MELSLFPLGTVLFPDGVLPLRIFEPRYVDMVGRCMREGVPFGVVLFERLMAATRVRGTSVFVVQLADGVGYTGSVVLQLYRDLAHPGRPRRPRR